MMKNVLLTVAVFCMTSTGLKADFTSLAIMQRFEHVISDDDAVIRLFNDDNCEILKMGIRSSQAKSMYVVVASKKKSFVKITREDCQLCNETSFDYEWELKKDKQKNNLVKAVNAELILPDKSAVFMLEGKEHLIVSYPWAPGKTLQDIYIDYLEDNKTSEALKIAMYRYGQVLATTDLDPNNPNDDIAKLLNRVPRMLLNDRHGGNTKYFERNDKIYLIDLSKVNNNMDQVTVGASIASNFREIANFLMAGLSSDRFDVKENEFKEIYRNGKGYLSIPFNQFIAGYISALPKYDPNVIKSMLIKEMYDMFRANCEAGMGVYCDLINGVRFIK
ncbi:MAG: hypothetical protein QS721_10120 [Candidatus Endonucleobacter sp. (ex Gigantidas childressi)]|nr:hypothetical protein [Candidatus Endonucleobacter sp. (ex Gigantidas childressi)]